MVTQQEKEFLESYPQNCPPDALPGTPGNLDSAQEKALATKKTFGRRWFH